MVLASQEVADDCLRQEHEVRTKTARASCWRQSHVRRQSASEIVVKTPTKRRGCFCNGGRASAHRRHRCLVLEDTDESLTHPMLPEMIDAQAQAQAQAQAPAPEMAQAKAQEMAQAKATAGGRLLILQLGATNDASGTPDPDVLARCPITVALHRAAVAAGRAVTVRSR